MALIVEDGSGVANANSYETLVGIRAYALSRGVTLSATDSVVEAQAHKAMDFLEAQRGRYQGDKTDPAQALQFPRTGVKVDCVEIAADAIPAVLVQAQCRLIMEQHAGVELTPTRTEGFIIEDTTGPLTTKYSDKHGGGPGSTPIMPAVEALLSPLYSACGQGLGLRVVRV